MVPQSQSHLCEGSETHRSRPQEDASQPDINAVVDVVDVNASNLAPLPAMLKDNSDDFGSAVAPTQEDATSSHAPLSSMSSGCAQVYDDNPQSTSSPDTPSEKSKFTKAISAISKRASANVGLLLVACAQVFFSIMNLSVKEMHVLGGPHISTLQIVFFRMGLTWVCCVTYMLLFGVQSPILGPKGFRMILAFRGITGFFAIFGLYCSLQYLSLSDATVLTFLAPLGTVFAGALFLGEQYTIREVFASVCSLSGVVLIARPAFIFGSQETQLRVILPLKLFGVLVVDQDEGATSAERLIAVGFALMGVMGSVGTFLSLRAMGKRLERPHPLHAMVAFATQSMILSLGFMAIMGETFDIPRQWELFACLVGAAAGGLGGQVLLAMGLTRETAARGTMGVYTQVVFAMILQRIFFHTLPSLLSMVGTIIIIASALYVALSNDAEIKPKRRGGDEEEGLLGGEDGKEDDEVDGEDGHLGLGGSAVESLHETETSALAP